ncbi:MAG: ATP-binding cassette domain-containing protein [Haloarculaceae archaeon]
MTSAITVDGVGKRYGDVTALDDVSFGIEGGELFGLLGPNGAGKSTLVHVLSTLVRPTAGDATVAGHDVRTDRDGVRASIGVVFQEPALDEELTARENLSFHGVMYGIDRAERRDRIADVLALVELDERADDLVKTYSGGMKRRLEIARGLVHRPAVLFLDEPTLGLDAQTRRRIWAYVRRLNGEAGVTVVLTTHYMEEADALCDRVGIIDDGELVELGTPAALKDRVGGDVVTVSVEGDRDAFRARLADYDWLNTVEESNGASGVESNGESDEATDGTFRLTVDHGDERVPTLFRDALAGGWDITSVAMREPSLEDVFLDLTGKAIREQAAESRVERMVRARRGR